MKNKLHDQLIRCGILLGVFLLFTLLVRFVDVKPIGANGTKVGFASLNGWVFNLLKGEYLDYRPFWYRFTKLVGYLSILLALAFCLQAAWDAWQNKSIWKMDYRLFALVAFYAVVFSFYLLFEKIVVNYRPVILDAELGAEPSYPSSHTMLALCIMATAIKFFPRYLKDRVMSLIAGCSAVVVMVIMVFGRMLSNVHWFTDILGGVLASVFLLSLYDLFVLYIKPEKEEIRRESEKTGRTKMNRSNLVALGDFKLLLSKISGAIKAKIEEWKVRPANTDQAETELDSEPEETPALETADTDTEEISPEDPVAAESIPEEPVQEDFLPDDDLPEEPIAFEEILDEFIPEGLDDNVSNLPE